MLSLVLYTCLATGGDCYWHVQADHLGYSECQVASMPEVAKWATQHPKRKFVKLTCIDERRVGYLLGRNQA